MEKRYDDVAQRMYGQYVLLVCAETSSRCVERAAHAAEAIFFEQLFQLVAGVLDLLFRGQSDMKLRQLHRDFSRMFRTPSFNTTVTWQGVRTTSNNASDGRVKWSELPRRRNAAAGTRAHSVRLPVVHRRLGVNRAKLERSPLVSLRVPSHNDKVKAGERKRQQLRLPQLRGAAGAGATVYCRQIRQRM